MSLRRVIPFYTVCLASLLLRAGDDMLFNPLRVKGDRGGVVQHREDLALAQPFAVRIAARSAEEAWGDLQGRFDQALRPWGLQPVDAGDWQLIQGLPGASHLQNQRLYRCQNPGAMQRLRGRLFFVNGRTEARGWVRQIVVGVSPLPDADRGLEGGQWRDQYGVRVYLIGRPEGQGAQDELPFDASPLLSELAGSLGAAAR